MPNPKTLLLLATTALAFTAACHSAPDEEEAAYARELRFDTPTDTTCQVAFLHLTDLHGSDVSLRPALYYQEHSDCLFTLLTGDIMATDDMIAQLGEAAKPCLLVPGNHDAYTLYAGATGQLGFRTDVLNTIGMQRRGATFGSPVGNFWVSDFRAGEHTLRVIGIDQYELQSVGHPADDWGALQNLYSQRQVDWLIRLLEQSRHIDGLIIAIHNGFGNRQVGQRDPAATGPFTSILANQTDEGYDYYGTGNTLLVPDIVEAYLTGRNLTARRYANSAVVGDTLTVTTHFTRPADNFIAYLGGHLHYDVAETLPGYPRQLQVLLADCGQAGQSQGLDDILKGQQGNVAYCFNLNIVDLRRRRLTIHRMGANHKVDGTLRDSVVFSY